MKRFDEHIETLIKRVIGAAISVHRELGPGFPESVYSNSLAIELDYQGIPFSKEHRFDVSYRNKHVGEGRMDFLIDNRLVLELKAIESLAPVHDSQVVVYLNHQKEPVGLLINFNDATLKAGLKRIINPRFE